MSGVVSADFRVTQASMARRATAQLQQSLARMDTLQQQVSTGRRIDRASDDPVGTISALRFRNDLSRSTQIGRNIDDALGWLGTADDALSTVVDQVQRVRDLALQAQNGVLGQSERDAIAVELDTLRASLLGVANAKFGTRYVFAGTAVGPAYDVSSGAYAGTAGAVERTVAPGTRVQVNVDGADVFGPAGGDLFAVVGALAADVRAGDTAAMAGDLAGLDARTLTIQSRLAEVGARTQRVETMKNRNDSGAITLRQGLSAAEDVDMPKALMELQMQQVSYQAALSATARVIQPTLVDFLR